MGPSAGIALAPAVPAASLLGDRFMHAILYITVLSSFFVFIQPAPYEYLAVVLGVGCLVARVKFPLLVAPLLILLVIRDGSGAVSLFQNLEYDDAKRFLATSFYLGLTGVMFACMLAHDSMRRITTLRNAYILSGTVASILGVLGFFEVNFKFLPGLDVFSVNDRALAGFKDPNVLGAFLVPPLTWQIERYIVDRIRPHTLLAGIIMFTGLLLAFSRAAWGSFAFCFLGLMYLLFVTQNDKRIRKRILFFVASSAIAAFVVITVLMSIDEVRDMFVLRFSLLQQYDSGGEGTRFTLQENSVREILDHPWGMGPWQFQRVYGWVSHNTFLGITVNQGWIGGAAYLALILLSLVVGVRTFCVRTPWQTFLIASYLPFLALVLEGLVVDTDHWRHFYLLIGIVWGLAAATQKAAQHDPTASATPYSGKIE